MYFFFNVFIFYLHCWGTYKYDYCDPYQGSANDKTKEYTLAKDRGIHIVSPHWLYVCQEKNERVDEAMYPHTFNPKLNLPVVTTGRRVTRSSKAVSIVI